MTENRDTGAPASDPSEIIQTAWRLVQQQQAEQSLKLLADLLNRDQTNIDAWLAAGSILERFGELSQAADAYRRVIAMEERHRAARVALAAVLLQQRAVSEAELLVNRLVADDSQAPESWALLSHVRQRQARHAESVDAMRRAVTLSHNAAYHSRLLLAMQYVDDVSPRELLAAHRQWDLAYAGPHLSAPVSRPAAHLLPRPLRIGFVSADFGRHPTGFLVLRPLECLDKSQIFVACYYDRYPEDNYTARFKAAADLWHVSADWSDERLAEQIRADQIDILFDLMGHTGKRLLCFARKPAAVQITWAGYVGTTGLATMDYLLADRFHIRPGEEVFYSEKILRMPNDYVCYGAPPGNALEVSPLPARISDHVTFGCFNNATKLSEWMLDAWAEILRRVPSARLLLKTHGFNQPALRDRVHVHFATHSIGPERVLLEAGCSHRELLAAYSRIDLALDTQPYSGGLTTCEALWMGVPVITFPGKTFAGRHSMSHLSNAGLDQFIAPDLPGYIELAVAWASRIDELAALRSQMRSQLLHSPLCNAAQFAHDLLSLLQQTVVLNSAF